MLMERRSPEDELVEQPAIEWLEELGWGFVHGPDIGPDGSAPEREQYRDVVLAGRLERFLRRRYPEIPVVDLRLVVTGIQTTASPAPIADHADFHRILIEGFPLTYTDKEGMERSARINLVDFKQPENNDFAVVNQMTIIVGGKNRRPDLLLFVNGIPLGQLELKSPLHEVGS